MVNKLFDLQKCNADLSLAAGKKRKNELVTGGFRCDLQNHRRLPACKHFQSENLQSGLLEGFLKLESNFKGAR
jgi:hypothetical protein